MPKYHVQIQGELVLRHFCACRQPTRPNQRNCPDCQRLAQRRYRARKKAELELLRSQVGVELAMSVRKQARAQHPISDHPKKHVGPSILCAGEPREHQAQVAELLSIITASAENA